MKRATFIDSAAAQQIAISIHALVKRATIGDRSYSGAKLVISIHALVKRATGFEMSFLLP